MVLKKCEYAIGSNVRYDQVTGGSSAKAGGKIDVLSNLWYEAALARNSMETMITPA